MESTSNRMSRLGKSLITDSELLDLDRILAEIEAVNAQGVAELTGALLARERISVAAVGPNQKRVLNAVAPVYPGLISAAAA
jgi:predicted Zn-dependent peptidase